MKKFAVIAVAASMFALAACEDAPKSDPTSPVIEEPDTVEPGFEPSGECPEGPRADNGECL